MGPTIDRHQRIVSCIALTRILFWDLTSRYVQQTFGHVLLGFHKLKFAYPIARESFIVTVVLKIHYDGLPSLYQNDEALEDTMQGPQCMSLATEFSSLCL